jgi:protein-S-isoprenylcysteine O-methyltransferase Ste14
MIHPFFCYLFISLTFTVSLGLFIPGHLDLEKCFYIPIWLMIILYTMHAILTDTQQYTSRSLRQVIPKALGRYVLWALILLGVVSFYRYHPLYRDFALHTRTFVADFLKVYLILGLPYHVLAEKYRYCADNVMSDAYVRSVALFRCLYKRQFHRAKRMLVHRTYKRMYMGAILRVHYIPIMVEQVYFGLRNMSQFVNRPDFMWSLSSVVAMGVTMAWLIDSNNGAIGYFWESRFSKSRFREIDLNPIHWFVVLICYMPFIRYASDFVPFPTPPTGSAQLINSPAVNLGIETVLMVLVVLYMLSGAALAFSTSNLCYKKIQTRGPYAIVRHPATIFKLTYFCLAFFRYRSAFSLLGLVLFLVWMTVYVSRALVEEAFLKKTPEYRAYMKKTRYRFIPGVC